MSQDTKTFRCDDGRLHNTEEEALACLHHPEDKHFTSLNALQPRTRNRRAALPTPDPLGDHDIDNNTVERTPSPRANASLREKPNTAPATTPLSSRLSSLTSSTPPPPPQKGALPTPISQEVTNGAKATIQPTGRQSPTPSAVPGIEEHSAGQRTPTPAPSTEGVDGFLKYSGRLLDFLSPSRGQAAGTSNDQPTAGASTSADSTSTPVHESSPAPTVQVCRTPSHTEFIPGEDEDVVPTIETTPSMDPQIGASTSAVSRAFSPRGTDKRKAPVRTFQDIQAPPDTHSIAGDNDNRLPSIETYDGNRRFVRAARYQEEQLALSRARVNFAEEKVRESDDLVDRLRTDQAGLRSRHHAARETIRDRDSLVNRLRTRGQVKDGQIRWLEGETSTARKNAEEFKTLAMHVGDTYRRTTMWVVLGLLAALGVLVWFVKNSGIVTQVEKQYVVTYLHGYYGMP